MGKWPRYCFGGMAVLEMAHKADCCDAPRLAFGNLSYGSFLQSLSPGDAGRCLASEFSILILCDRKVR